MLEVVNEMFDRWCSWVLVWVRFKVLLVGLMLVMDFGMI